jgi:hypothetical protein
MESLLRPRLVRRTGAIALSLLVVVVAGCGSGGDYKNQPRPPSPINVTAYVSNKSVSVSPTTFGAGPIVVIVTNQSPRSQDVTLETDTLGTGKTGIKQTTGLINPGQTGQIKVDVAEGDYKLAVGDTAIKAAKVTVGPQRPSSQNQLLQP